MTELSITVTIFSLVHQEISQIGLVSTWPVLHLVCISLSPDSPSLLTLVPSLKQSDQFLSISLLYSSFRCFYQAHSLFLTCFAYFFPILCSTNLIFIFQSSQFCNLLYLFTQTLSLTHLFSSCSACPAVPISFPHIFQAFPTPFHPPPLHFYLSLFGLVSHWHQPVPVSSANFSSRSCEGIVFLPLVPSRGFSCWRGERKSFLLMVACKLDIICNYQASCFSPVLNYATSKWKLWKTWLSTYELC